jgi:hypothetical protein
MCACICDIVLLHFITDYNQETINLAFQLNSNTWAHMYAALTYVYMQI